MAVFKSNLTEVIAEIEARSAQNVVRGTEYMRSKLIDKVDTVGDGRVYKVPQTNVTHQASSEGNPPAVLTGALKNSFQTRYEHEKHVHVGYVGPVNIPYAKRLEFGFKGEDALGRVYDQEPRPYMTPTAFEEEENIGVILKGGVVPGE